MSSDFSHFRSLIWLKDFKSPRLHFYPDHQHARYCAEVTHCTSLKTRPLVAFPHKIINCYLCSNYCTSDMCSSNSDTTSRQLFSFLKHFVNLFTNSLPSLCFSSRNIFLLISTLSYFHKYITIRITV